MRFGMKQTDTLTSRTEMKGNAIQCNAIQALTLLSVEESKNCHADPLFIGVYVSILYNLSHVFVILGPVLCTLGSSPIQAKNERE